MIYKGQDLVYYICPECGKRRLLWKKDSPPVAHKIQRTVRGINVQEYSTVCRVCYAKYNRRIRRIIQADNQKLREERSGNSA